jgi:hypothetical protein
MDDDDYYPPERVEHAVDTLMANKEALCAGSSEMYIYFKHINQMVQCGPYGPNHATAGTFAFKSRLLDDTQYEDHAALAEEKAFLKNYTVPFVQLDPLKTILVFSHIHNTFDKKRLIDPSSPVCKESNIKVKKIIKDPMIYQFYTEEIDLLLESYELGQIKNKPDVLEEIKRRDNQQKASRQINIPELMEALLIKTEENLALQKEVMHKNEYIRLLTENIKARGSVRLE